MIELAAPVITRAGVKLIAKAIKGSLGIEFDNMEAGDGELPVGLTDAERIAYIKQLNGLMNSKANFSITSKKLINDDTVQIKSVMTNENLTQSFVVNEIALFAIDPDVGRILYAYLPVTEPEPMPKQSAQSISRILVDLYIAVADAERVVVRIQNGIYALASDVQDILDFLHYMPVIEFSAALNPAKYIKIHDYVIEVVSYPWV